MQRLFSIMVVAGFLAAVAAPATAGDGGTARLDYDRVIPFSGIEQFDGADDAQPASAARFRQAVHEMHRSTDATLPWPSAEQLRYEARRSIDAGEIPIALLNTMYRRGGTNRRAFVAATLGEYTYRGERVVFSLAPRHYLSDDPRPFAGLEIDLDDGQGYRPVAFDAALVARYPTIGIKTLRTRLTNADLKVLHGSFRFDVRSLAAPLPDDTLSVTATIDYNANFGTGDAYVYLAAGHTSIVNPVVVAEGFDLDNTMNWDELYALLNDELLIETLRADGYDAVILNFTEATAPIQENAFVLVELLAQVQAAIAPQRRFPLIGASMGGLVGRYALGYMETNAIAHRVATFITFDTPHRGANIPLGIQYWLNFFKDDSADAAFLLSRLDTPAARQMLVYHHTDPPSSSPSSDPLRASFQSDLSAVGSNPTMPRKVAVANGSAAMQNQGFAAGAQVIDYNFIVFLLATVKGNVWAVPDGGSARIFEGVFNVILVGNRSQDVNVSGTLPYDNAPGGYRGSMAEMDATTAPFGDIVALHDNHCFVPTVSALDLNTGNLFHDVAGDPGLSALHSFDAVYYPLANQSHVDVTPENALWLLTEIEGTPSAVERPAVTGPRLSQNVPNPFNPVTTIGYELARTGAVTLSVYDLRGRRVATLVDRVESSGSHVARWAGRNDQGHPVASGVYFYRLQTPAATMTRKMLLLK